MLAGCALSARRASAQALRTVGTQAMPIAGVQTCAPRSVAVGAGKGGVGKSTVSVNLAAALYRKGFRVGLLDADIYGPSVPRMMGLEGQRASRSGDKIAPTLAHGLKVMSMGLLLDASAAMVWRGPMVGSAVHQLLFKVDWGVLDFLVVDLPPGTGDAQLTLAQAVRLMGAVLVTTPQQVAVSDVRRAATMFRNVRVPLLGVVENMSSYVCPCCGHRDHVFGRDGGRSFAEAEGLPFLGELPINSDVFAGAESGVPVVVGKPESPVALAYADIAEKLATVALDSMSESAQREDGADDGPQIVMER